VRLWVALALVCALIAGCGDDSAATDEPAAGLAVPWIDPDGDPPIVGSLAVNPADSTLFMATNTGLFRIPDGASKPEKVVGQLETPDGAGEVSEALVVRFVGPDTLLGSGHPAAGSALPQALGLIRSEDAGKTWTSVSELGTADFHAIEPAGDDIVGALFQQPQVLVSADEGKTWETRAAPLPLVALEVNPEDPQLWIGSTDRGIFSSRDAGKTWRQLDPTPNVRFAWADDGTLYRIDPGGPLKVSTDGGQNWEDRGSTGGEPQAMTVDDSGKVYVALIDGTLKASDNGGQTFTDQIRGG
jgi:Sortilin, neurotensin receptor 3,/BNR/Asp-box repeat